MPSADTLRHFLYAFHDPTLIEAAQARRAPAEVAARTRLGALRPGIASG